MKPVLAIDVGGVLASQQHDGIPQTGSQGALWRLSYAYDLWIVSQCGQKRRLDTAIWLAEHDFPIPPERQIYVSFKETKIEPLHRIKAAYFIDDRMKHVKPALMLPLIQRVFHYAADFDDLMTYPVEHPKYQRVLSWESIENHLMRKSS